MMTSLNYILAIAGSNRAVRSQAEFTKQFVLACAFSLGRFDFIDLISEVLEKVAIVGGTVVADFINQFE